MSSSRMSTMPIGATRRHGELLTIGWRCPDTRRASNLAHTATDRLAVITESRGEPHVEHIDRSARRRAGHMRKQRCTSLDAVRRVASRKARAQRPGPAIADTSRSLDRSELSDTGLDQLEA